MGMSKEQIRALAAIVLHSNLDFTEFNNLVCIAKAMNYGELYAKGRKLQERLDKIADELWDFRVALESKLADEPGA